jgi:hypothetical protein
MSGLISSVGILGKADHFQMCCVVLESRSILINAADGKVSSEKKNQALSKPWHRYFFINIEMTTCNS